MKTQQAKSQTKKANGTPVQGVPKTGRTRPRTSSAPPATASSTSGLEGEGSYTGTRAYNDHVKNFVKSGKVDESARKAREALDGEEAKALREAERKAKIGPRR